jgi:hypothetical protein
VQLINNGVIYATQLRVSLTEAQATDDARQSLSYPQWVYAYPVVRDPYGGVHFGLWHRAQAPTGFQQGAWQALYNGTWVEYQPGGGYIGNTDLINVPPGHLTHQLWVHWFWEPWVGMFDNPPKFHGIERDAWDFLSINC